MVRTAATVTLTLAISEYDHVRDLMSDEVRPEGIQLNIQTFPIQEIFHRFTHHREWDVSEMSMGMYVSLLSQGDNGLVGIPVFPSRMFRLSSLYVRRDGPVKTLADLKGKRVGHPEWAQTAAVYVRGYLEHSVGVPTVSIEWIQAGINEPGRVENVKTLTPAGVSRSSRPDSSLDAMLLNGEVDAVMTALPPRSFAQSHPNITRLVGDFIDVESADYRKTGIFPIMHIVAMRRDVYERLPWAPMNLFRAFEIAKKRSLERMQDCTLSRFPHPWAFAWADQERALFGPDVWPYGIGPNRRTLEAFLAFCQEQGVTHRPVTVDEMFVPEVHTSFKV